MLLIDLRQWFPTRVSRHTRIPQGGDKGAAKYQIHMDFKPILTPRIAAKY
jgi:hypothetical protein